MSYDTERLYGLLPAIYRIRDAEQGEPLRALVAVLAEQLGVLEEDLAQLYDDQFIETCAPWVVPYIGDLVGNSPLFDIGRPLRADVARTIHYRRRKGTLHQLEETARDVTGWGCRAVESFRLLDWNQNLNHLRMENIGCANVRDINTMDLVDTALDTTAHTADVRPIGQAEGWHNIKNIGFFLWRLRSYPLDRVPARPVNDAGDWRYHFSVLGNPSPLFNHPLSLDETTGETREVNVPSPIRPLALHRALPQPQPDLQEAWHEIVADGPYWGRDFSITVDGAPATEVICRDLSEWRQPSSPGVVMLDVRRGRMAFAEAPTNVLVSYHYGFSSDIGGGPYDRLDTLAEQELTDVLILVKSNPTSNALKDAIDAWAGGPDKKHTVIQITDNAVYEFAGPLSIPLAGRRLTIEAADGCRPCLRLTGDVSVSAENGDDVLSLNGLLIEGAELAVSSALNLSVTHCTLVPGRALNSDDGMSASPELASLTVGAGGATVTIASSILGPLRIHTDSTLTVTDSIIDAPEGAGGRVLAITGADDSGFGPKTTLLRTTLLGGVRVREMALASEVIFADAVEVERLQTGCVRFSFVPEESVTPRRYRCQPCLAKEQAVQRAIEAAVRDHRPEPGDTKKELIRAGVSVWLKPAFTAVRYGHPAYGQLNYYCPEEIRTGAEDGSEMGVFCSLRNPQREANLRIRLEEYLPVGLAAGLIYVT